MPWAKAPTMMAPVEVPDMNEKTSRAGLPICCSSATSAHRGMIPRIPPPSMARRAFFVMAE
jgi:hypothetical protein